MRCFTETGAGLLTDFLSGLVPISGKLLICGLLVVQLAASNAANASVCYGTSANGRLDNGVQLAAQGANFEGYSSLARLLGRTYVHAEVAAIVHAAYSDLTATHPDKVFKYAETGLARGGRFKPHKTHRNGLSVDFMVPVVDASGRSVQLPTHIFNKLGYNIEFDSDGHYRDYRIDYPALAAHLMALQRAAEARGHSIKRVIFDPALQPQLFAAEGGTRLQRELQFSTRPAWVRHDEHYHVDFNVPCEP